MIEIELAGGHRLRAEAGVDLALLQGAIAALTRG
jgi:transposase